MKSARIFMLSLAFALLGAALALAAATPAGTEIVNTANVTFKVQEAELTQASNEVKIVVAELIDVTLTWEDATNVVVQPGDTDQMLTFKLSNTGNGSESFILERDNSVIDGDQFDPTATTATTLIYLDNGDQQYDAEDTAYDPATNLPTLDGGKSMLLFVFNDIPATTGDPATPADGDLGISRLGATSKTVSDEPASPGAGDALAGQGDGAIDAVVGASGGTASIDGIYQVSQVEVTLTKSASVTDPWGGSEPVPGATIEYTIKVEVTGSSTAKAVTVNDLVPEHTTYVPGSLKLDDGIEVKSFTDAAGDDAGEVVELTDPAGRYQTTVRLGDMTGTSNEILFQVKID